MQNKILPFDETKSRIKIVRGLLSRMDADIVAPDGSLPDINVERVGRLMPGGYVVLYTENHENCYLETNYELVRYEEGNPRLDLQANIHFFDLVENPSKHEMKSKNYHFRIKLAGQRRRQE
jgi:hypothetical protein